MSFTDYLSTVVNNIDADIPDELLPTTIFNTASMLAHLSSDSIGTQAWI